MLNLNMASLIVCVLLALTYANFLSANVDSISYHVTLHVFSGTPDPVWTLSAGSPGFEFLAQRLPHMGTSLASRLGYSGFTVVKSEGTTHLATITIGRCTMPLIEGDLFSVLRPLTPDGGREPLQPAVTDYISQQISNC